MYPNFTFDRILAMSEWGINFKSWLGEWIDIKHTQALVKETTLSSYMQIISTYIPEDILNLDMSELSSEKLQRLVNNLHATRHLSKATMNLICVVLNGATEAWNDSHNRVFEKVSCPIVREKKPKIEVFSHTEQQKLVKYIFQHITTKTVAIAIALMAGLRIGEICALKWSDIDLKEDKIKVTATLKRVKFKPGENWDTSKTQLIRVSPKTSTSYRDVPITTTLHMLMMTIEPEENDRNKYIVSGTSKPIEPRSLFTTYKSILRKIDLPALKFHALRHTFATDSMSAGMNVKVLAVILGHANVTTTLNLYQHPVFDDLRKSILLLEENWA